MSSTVTVKSNNGLEGGNILVNGGAILDVEPPNGLSDTQSGITNGGSGLIWITGSGTSVTLSGGASFEVDAGNLTINGGATINWSNKTSTDCPTGHSVAHFTTAQPSGHVINFTEDSFLETGLTVASRSWNFGDTGTSTSANPSHTYASAGTYTVTFTMTDNDGNSSTCTLSLVVS